MSSFSRQGKHPTMKIEENAVWEREMAIGKPGKEIAPPQTDAAPPVRAVLFADVSGWTDLTSRIGDQAALTLRDRLFRPLRKIVHSRRGRVVKTMGDELMCVFDSAQDAAGAAREMQLHAEAARRHAKEPLSL